MAKKYFPRLTLRRNDYEGETREPGEKRIIEGRVNIDYNVFKKSKAEKELLKVAKAEEKRKSCLRN